MYTVVALSVLHVIDWPDIVHASVSPFQMSVSVSFCWANVQKEYKNAVNRIVFLVISVFRILKIIIFAELSVIIVFMQVVKIVKSIDFLFFCN